MAILVQHDGQKNEQEEPADIQRLHAAAQVSPSDEKAKKQNKGEVDAERDAEEAANLEGPAGPMRPFLCIFVGDAHFMSDYPVSVSVPVGR
jgi:hypothetical protein